MVKIAQTTIDNRRNRQSPGTCFKGSVSILKTLVIAKYAPIPVKISFINSPSSGWWKRRKPRVLVALAAFVLLSLLNGLSVRTDRDVNDLRLLRSLCRLLRFVVLRHHVVDGTASHRACGSTCDSQPEAATRRGCVLVNRLIHDGRVLLHDCRALRCIALRRSRTGERSTAAEASTATCISGSGDKESGQYSRQENLFHFLRITKNPLANACGFVSFGHDKAPISGAAESNREPTALSIPRYFSTFSSRESTISKNFATALSLCIRKVFCPSESFCSITHGEVKQQ